MDEKCAGSYIANYCVHQLQLVENDGRKNNCSIYQHICKLYANTIFTQQMFPSFLVLTYKVAVANALNIPLYGENH